MARPSSFHREDLLNAVVAVAARLGPGALTMTAVAAAAGAPTGSLYHRFPSRDALLAEAWLSSMGSFQGGFLKSLSGEARPVGLAAALFPVQWSRDHLDAARILVLHRRQDFVAGPMAEPLRALAAAQASDLDRGISTFAQAAWGDGSIGAKERAIFLLLDLPNAAMRRYLAAGMIPPPAVDALVTEAVLALSTRAFGPD